LSAKDLSYLALTKSSYNKSERLLTSAFSSLSIAKTTSNNEAANTAVSDGLLCLEKVFETLNNSYDALEYTITSSNFSDAELSAYKSNISSHLTIIGSGLTTIKTVKYDYENALLAYDTNVSSAEDQLTHARVSLDDAIRLAKDNLETAKVSGDQQKSAAQSKVNNTKEAYEFGEAQLRQVKSPARSEDISLAQSQIRQAEASLNLIKKQIEDSLIKSPLNGQVTDIDKKIGEQVMAGTPVISILEDGEYEIEMDISEADIAKINLNNQAEVTLDAFGEDVVFNGTLVFIEPAETVIQDVIYYKVKVAFDENDALNNYKTNIKSGMTANVTITTAKKDDVVLMPMRAIIEKNGGDKHVRVLKKGEIIERYVKTGLRGDGGLIEVVAGVKEGDEVVTYIKD
jgi:multidrug efflux pump subunit AcrA (membrane-fusion protein)